MEDLESSMSKGIESEVSSLTGDPRFQDLLDDLEGVDEDWTYDLIEHMTAIAELEGSAYDGNTYTEERHSSRRAA